MRLLDFSFPLKEKKQALHDLDMSRLLCRIDDSLTEEKASGFLNTYLCCDSQELLLRSQLLEEFSEKCSLEELQQLSEDLGSLPGERHSYEIHEEKLKKILYRYRRIRLYVICIKKFCEFGDRGFTSSRMLQIIEKCQAISKEPQYLKYQFLLKQQEDLIQFPKTVEVAINTNRDGFGQAIGIIGVDPSVRKDHPLIGHEEGNQESTGLFGAMRYSSNHFGTHLEEYLVTVLEKEWRKPISKSLELWEKIDFPDERAIEVLSQDLAYFCLGIKLIRYFQKQGYPVCRPQMLSDSDPFLMKADEMIYPELTFRTRDIQGNPVSLQASHSAIITGANHSGKTSFLKTVGQNLLLAQLGFFAVAKSLSVKPVHNLYTLFSAGEDENMTASRMGIEIRLLAEMTRKACPGDLVIINEPLTSTNPLEAISICSDLLKTFLQKEVPCLMVTHLYDVYFLLRSSLEDSLQSNLKSLVTCSRFNEKEQKMNYDYSLMENEPLGNSYARETALAYGITLDEMITEPRQRDAGIRFCRSEEENTLSLTKQN